MTLQSMLLWGISLDSPNTTVEIRTGAQEIESVDGDLDLKNLAVVEFRWYGRRYREFRRGPVLAVPIFGVAVIGLLSPQVDNAAVFIVQDVVAKAGLESIHQ